MLYTLYTWNSPDWFHLMDLKHSETTGFTVPHRAGPAPLVEYTGTYNPTQKKIAGTNFNTNKWM